MVSETLIGKLSMLNARLAELATLRQFAEMSNGRAHSDGTLAGYDREMSIVRQDIDRWYRDNSISVNLEGQSAGLVVSSADGGKTFNILSCHFPSPGVMRKIEFNLARDDAEKLIGFFGGQQVDYLNTPMDAVSAFVAIERRFKEAASEVGRLRIRNRELEEALNNQNQELQARYDDAHS